MTLEPMTNYGWSFHDNILNIMWDSHDNIAAVRERINVLLKGLKAANVPLNAQQNAAGVVRMGRIAQLGVGVGTVIIMQKRRRERILKMS